MEWAGTFFGPYGGTNARVDDVALQSDGKIVVVGYANAGYSDAWSFEIDKTLVIVPGETASETFVGT
jgi:hypothetical protein